VRVNVEEGMSQINTWGLSWNGSAHVNEADSASAAAIELDVDADIGTINGDAKDH